MAKRRDLDAYYSPEIVPQWLDKYSTLVRGSILEPCCGDGIISNYYKQYSRIVITNDINPTIQSDYHLDILKPETWERLPKCDWLVTNPPFSAINEFLPMAFKHARVGLAVFCRKSVTESTYKRQHWLKTHNERHLAQIIFCPRVSFTGDGNTDKVSADWLIYTKAPVDGCKIAQVLK